LAVPIPPRLYRSRGILTGPRGCNQFIFHLPRECDAIDLVMHFSHCPRVIGLAIDADGDSNESKCLVSAQRTIAEMNHYGVGAKEPKVNLNNLNG
uniref:Uncharacterized protein n=1 Tax=Echinococcus canadensis TaxID=519352 RepID=A0A915F034_9CEST